MNQVSLSSVGITVCGRFCSRHQERTPAGRGKPATTDTLTLSIFPELLARACGWRGVSVTPLGKAAGGQRRGSLTRLRVLSPLLERGCSPVLAPSRPLSMLLALCLWVEGQPLKLDGAPGARLSALLQTGDTAR